VVEYDTAGASNVSAANAPLGEFLFMTTKNAGQHMLVPTSKRAQSQSLAMYERFLSGNRSYDGL
jgi:hypothetical protein